MRRMLALLLLVALLVPAVAQARVQPRDHDGDSGPGQPEPPINFATALAQFMGYSEDVAALRSWYENLSPTEQERYAADYKAALDKLAGMEDTLFGAITGQLDEACCDSYLYVLFTTIKGTEAIKARKIFSGLVDKLSDRINHDYVSNPSNADMGRRARDMQAVRAYIGRAGAAAR